MPEPRADKDRNSFGVTNRTKTSFFPITGKHRNINKYDYVREY